MGGVAELYQYRLTHPEFLKLVQQLEVALVTFLANQIQSPVHQRALLLGHHDQNLNYIYCVEIFPKFVNHVKEI